MTDADVRGIGQALPARAAGLATAILIARTALFGGSAIGVYDG